MDKIPLQTLKPHVKISSEELVTNLTLEVKAVNRNFKPTVRSRREFEPEDDIDFDIEFEKELDKVETDIDYIHLTATLPKIQEELDMWVREYKELLEEFHNLHEDNAADQALLKHSDERIQEKLGRIAKIDGIKKSLLKEVKRLCLTLEKHKAESDDKLKRSTKNYKDIIKYLNRGFETERLGFQNTSELMRKLEHTLRDTFNHLQNSEATVDVLQAELKKTKHQLHALQNEAIEKDQAARKATARIQKLDDDLYDAVDRAEFAEKALKNYRNKF